MRITTLAIGTRMPGWVTEGVQTYTKRFPRELEPWLEAARAGRPLEVRSDDPLRDWTYAPDLARALEALLRDGPARKPVHLGSSNLLRDREVAERIAEVVPGSEICGSRP